MPRTNKQYGNIDARQQFCEDMRLVLYYGRIFKVYLEALRTNSVCPSGIKQNCLNTESSIRRQENSILLNVSEKDREFLREDLNKDQIAELGEILRLLANVDNPEAVTDAVKKAKFEKSTNE